MKKRKLTKEQIEKRKHFLKLTKNVVFYISLALNTIFLVALCVSGCSSSKANVRQNNDAHTALLDKPQLDKNNLVSASNNNSVAYDVTYFGFKSQTDLGFSGSLNRGNIGTTLGSGYCIMLNNSPETLQALNTDVYYSYDVHSPLQDGDFININWGFEGYRNYWTYSDTYHEWRADFVGAKQIFLPQYSHNDSDDELDLFKETLSYFFNEVKYIDYDWSISNWNPYALYGYVSRADSSGNPSYDTLVTDVLFSIDGDFYNTIRVFWTGSGIGVYNATEDKTETWSNLELIQFVEVRNTLTNRSRVIMQTQMYINDGNYYYIPDTLYFPNLASSRIRLFDYHISATSNYSATYTNVDIFNLSYHGVGSGSSGSGQFGDVFSLFTTAFSGLTGLLSISILPGITIGILVFLPLVGIIVFALIRIIKK